LNHQTILLEAECFDSHGGWKLDTQFIRTMGSPYLIAHGLGTPVENASTEIDVPTEAAYHVWVRTKNWIPGEWEAPGRFEVIIDGKTLPTQFGTEPGWSWQKGGSISLCGKTRIELRDLTGFDARCDAMLLTTDSDYIPNNSNEPMSPWRRELLGISQDPDPLEYDMVVVGGGLAGIGSAISAARLGMRVALIQNRPVLGGNGSSEVTVPPEGRNPKNPYGLFNIIDELCVAVRPKNIGLPECYGDDIKAEAVLAERNIDLFLNCHAYKVESINSHIELIYTLSSVDSSLRIFTGRTVVDATGHGTIALDAGAEYVMEDSDRMGMTNLWRWRRTREQKSFPKIPWSLQLTEKMFPYPFDQNVRIGTWYWESGFDKHPLDDLEDIRDHNLRVIYSVWDAIKNHGAYAAKDPDQHETAELRWVAYIGGTRETLQIVGDVVLTKDDILSGKQYDDGCARATWGLDLHYPHPLYLPYAEDNPYISRAHFGGRVDDSQGELAAHPRFFVHAEGGDFDREVGYPIPYRCLYSRNIDNLFVPCRALSVTHEALGTVRVMRTLGMCGVAIGRAAYLGKKYNTTPRGVYREHLDELKSLWSEHGTYRID
jgi:hypothetical protein